MGRDGGSVARSPSEHNLDRGPGSRSWAKRPWQQHVQGQEALTVCSVQERSR